MGVSCMTYAGCVLMVKVIQRKCQKAIRLCMNAQNMWMNLSKLTPRKTAEVYSSIQWVMTEAYYDSTSNAYHTTVPCLTCMYLLGNNLVHCNSVPVKL